MTEKQGLIIGAGALAAVFLLKARKGTAAPKGVAIKPTAQAAPGHVSGSLAQPVSTNLATGNGQRTTAQVPSIAGFGTAIAATASIFQKLFGSKSTAPTGATPNAKPSAGPGGGGSAGSGAGGGGGAVKPGAAANAGAFLPDGTFVGGSTTGSSYDASSYLGINPQTGLYDPNYDPSVVYNPESNAAPVDPSMLPGPVFDENGLLTTDLPALGADGGDDPLAYFADTAVSPDGPPPDASVADLGAVDPSMFDAGTVDQSFAVGDDWGGGGGDAGYWDDAVS